VLTGGQFVAGRDGSDEGAVDRRAAVLGVVDPLVEEAQGLVQGRRRALEDLVDEGDVGRGGPPVEDLPVLAPGQRGHVDGAEHPRRRGELRQQDLPVGGALDPARQFPRQLRLRRPGRAEHQRVLPRQQGHHQRPYDVGPLVETLRQLVADRAQPPGHLLRVHLAPPHSSPAPNRPETLPGRTRRRNRTVARPPAPGPRHDGTNTRRHEDTTARRHDGTAPALEARAPCRGVAVHGARSARRCGCARTGADRGAPGGAQRDVSSRGWSAALWASMRSAARMAAAVSAREAATTRARPERAWARRCRAAALGSRPWVVADARAGLRPPRRRVTCSASRSAAASRSLEGATARSSSVTASSVPRWPASWMSSSSSRERRGTSWEVPAIVLWTDLARIGSYMDGLLSANRKPS